MNGSPFDSALLNRHFYFERSIVITPCRDSTPRLDTQLLPRARPSCGHRTIVRIDRRKSRSLWLGKAVVAAVLFHRKSGTIGAAVGLCRKKTESRGVNIIRGRKGHGGRRLNTPPRPYDLPTFFPPQSRWNLLVIFPVFLARRGSLSSFSTVSRAESSKGFLPRGILMDCYFEIFISICFSMCFWTMMIMSSLKFFVFWNMRIFLVPRTSNLIFSLERS